MGRRRGFIELILLVVVFFVFILICAGCLNSCGREVEKTRERERIQLEQIRLQKQTDIALRLEKVRSRFSEVMSTQSGAVKQRMLEALSKEIAELESQLRALE